MEVVVTVNRFDFEEVKKDITEEKTHELSNYCLNCKNPLCKTGCPLEIDIPRFISALKEGNYELAYTIISEKSVMPEVCGRVCPQELNCEAKCIRGIKGKSVSIGELERFASKYKTNLSVNSSNGKSVAIVGSGPFGLSAAYHLKRYGFDVTVFESSHVLGGVLVYGIPEFRLPKKIVSDIIEKLEGLGVKFLTDIYVGRTIILEELKEKYDYIFIGTGAGVPKSLKVPGIMAKNVMSANELLTRINLMKSPFNETPLNIPKTSAVIGGGNVACDAARCLVRLGSDVTIFYRKGEENLKMRLEEYNHAKEEGVKFVFNATPVKMETTDDFCVNSLVYKIDNKRQSDKVDAVIIAIGTTHNDLLLKLADLEVDSDHRIITHDFITSDAFIFAGGDATRGNATVIEALSDGYLAAKKLLEIVNK